MISRPLGAPFALDDENVSSGTTTFDGAPITRSGSTERTYSADVTWRRSPSISTWKSAGGEIRDLAPVRIERGDVHGDELDAGAKHRLLRRRRRRLRREAPPTRDRNELR